MIGLFVFLMSVPLSPVLRPTAYLDPGSGSFVIQIIFGVFVGAIVVLKAYWSKIRAYFSKEEEPGEDETDANNTDQAYD